MASTGMMSDRLRENSAIHLYRIGRVCARQHIFILLRSNVRHSYAALYRPSSLTIEQCSASIFSAASAVSGEESW